jgi:putative lipoic acid-binding regulatory protein
MTDTPKITFPCAYPIRIIGVENDGFARRVLDVVRIHDQHVTPDNVNLRHSNGGRYVSVAVTMTATGEEQLRALHADLMKLNDVKLVL